MIQFEWRRAVLVSDGEKHETKGPAVPRQNAEQDRHRDREGAVPEREALPRSYLAGKQHLRSS